jgi:acetyl-CoA acetyltransferase
VTDASDAVIVSAVRTPIGRCGLRRRGGGVGVGTLCAGGGMGSATVLEVHPAA